MATEYSIPSRKEIEDNMTMALSKNNLNTVTFQ